MTRFLSFPSIEQFRNVAKAVTERTRFHELVQAPTITFTGTVKLHGTNAGVVFTPEEPLLDDFDPSGFTGEMWAQSRSNIITPTDDNAGFAKFVVSNEFLLRQIYSLVIDDFGVFPYVGVYGEWCGLGIQKGVAISELDRKIFVVFGIRLQGEDENDCRWLTDKELNRINLRFDVRPAKIRTEIGCQIFFSTEFPTYEIELDFSSPVNLAEASHKLAELTMAVEKQCPVGYAFLQVTNVEVSLVDGKVIGNVADSIKNAIKPVLIQLLSKGKKPCVILNAK
jgi:hypothetical protein